MLEGIFERTARFCFAEIVQCQIYFGLGDGQDTEEFLNIGVSLGCCHYFYTKVCSLMTSGGDLCHVGMGKLIQINELVPAWYSFYRKVIQKLWYIINVEMESILVLCFGIGGGNARVPAPFHTWCVESFWSVLWCAESLQDWGVFFILVQVRLHDVKKIPQHCKSLTLELLGWRLSIKQHETLSSKKNCFSLSENIYLFIYLFIDRYR